MLFTFTKKRQLTIFQAVSYWDLNFYLFLAIQVGGVMQHLELQLLVQKITLICRSYELICCLVFHWPQSIYASLVTVVYIDVNN
jgi:hypothetical protein